MFILPEDVFAKDKVTPCRCTLLVLIREYALLFDGKNKNYPRMVWQDEWTSKRYLDRALLTWIQQPDGSLKDIMRVVSSCSKILYGEFTSMLDSMVNFGSIGGLEDFFINLGYSIFDEKESLLNKRGLLGLFSRRMLIYYERLSFFEIQPFFESFIKYCSPCISIRQPVSESMLKSKNNFSETVDGFAPLLHLNKDPVDDMELESQSEMDSKSSRESAEADLKPSDLKTDNKCDDFEVSECFAFQQAEFFFSQQAALIESKESDALSPSSLQNKIREVLKSNPELTQAHYVSYLNNLRLREFCGSVDSLFMCFIRKQKKAPNTNPNQDGESNRIQRFATLNLALLHLRFGHKKAAIAAAKESLRLSQISNDSLCLQHAMSLLNHLEPKMSSKKITDEVIKPGKKHNLTDLAFLAVQAHMRHLSRDGKNPAMIFRNLAAADALQCTRPFSYFASTSYAHKSSLWKMYGKKRMAIMHCQLVLSMQFAPDKKSRTTPTRYNSEDIALCYSHLIELLNEVGMINAAGDLLQHVKKRFPANLRFSQFWRKAEARCNHQSSLRLCKYIEARQMQQALLILDTSEAKLREAESLTSRNELLDSHTILRSLLHNTCDDSNNEVTSEMKCKVLLLMGEILCRNKCDRAISLKYLLEALSLAHRCYLHGLVNEALLKIAQLQLLSNSPRIALSCLRSFSFECLTNDDLYLYSRVLIVAVRCFLRLKDQHDVAELDTLISSLTDCRNGFDKLQDLARLRDVVYLLARLNNEKSKLFQATKSNSSKPYLAAIQHRNEYASEFKRLDIQIGSLSYTAVI